MIYDTVINTGGASLSDCSSSDLQTDNYRYYNRKAQGALNDVFFDNSVVESNNGKLTLQLFLNSQCLLQELPITGWGANKVAYKLDTGDFFVKATGEQGVSLNISALDSSQINFDPTTPLGYNDNICYNIITGGIFAGTGEVLKQDIGQELTSGISGTYPNINFTDFDFFLNGQKVYSGDGVGLKEGTNYQVAFGTSAAAGGIVDLNNQTGFKATAYKKKNRTYSITGITPDISIETGFIEGRNNYYINGLQESQSGYLELYTGVIIFKTGVGCLPSGGFGDSKTPKTINTIEL